MCALKAEQGLGAWGAVMGSHPPIWRVWSFPFSARAGSFLLLVHFLQLQHMAVSMSGFSLQSTGSRCRLQ